MAKKKQETDLETWKKRIQSAEKSRTKHAEEHGWSRYIDEYEGKYNFGSQTNNMSIPIINLVYGYVQTEIPKLYMRDPYISVNAKGKSFIQRAKVLETVVNYLINEINLKGEVDKVLMDTLLVSHGWLKFGYAGEFDKLDIKGIEHDVEFKDQLSTIKKEEIFCLYVPWDEILIDPLAKDAPNDSTWIVHSFIRPLDYVKTCGLYENTANLKSNVSLKAKEKMDRDITGDDVELVKLHEIWDVPSNRIQTISENHDKYLRNVDNDYEMEGLPFEKLYFNRNPKKGSQYPISDIEIIEPQILERIKLRAAQINHVKRWNRQAVIEKGAMDKEEMSKLELGIDGSVVQVNPGKQPPKPIEYAPFQAESFTLDRVIMSDMDAVIGQSEAERGGQAKTETKTLGELQTQLAGSVSRSQKRQDMLEDFIERVCRKFIALMKQFFDAPRYVQITDMTPEEVLQAFGPAVSSTFDGTGIMFTKEDIQGEFDVECKAGSTIPMNKQNRLKIIEMVMQMLPKIPKTPIGLELFKEILRDLGMKSAEKLLDQEMADMKKQQAQPQLPQLPKPALPGAAGLAPPSPVAPGVMPGMPPMAAANTAQPGIPAPQ